MALVQFRALKRPMCTLLFGVQESRKVLPAFMRLSEGECPVPTKPFATFSPLLSVRHKEERLVQGRILRLCKF